MNIVIKRLFTKGEYTHGSLSIDGTRICSTLENANATIEKQKAEMRKDLQREIVDVALAASTKLMGKDDLAEQDQRALESFVKEIQDESGR